MTVDSFGRMTRRAAAEALGIAEGTLSNWGTDGVGPRAYKQRGRVFYLASEVRDFALNGTQQAA